MLVLDFINVGNGDSILVREMENGEQKFAMLVDCGHDNLVRDDHKDPLDSRSMRIYAADFLSKHGVSHLDILLVTHFHRDHIGGLSRVLEAVAVDRLITPYLPPLDMPPINPDDDMSMPKAARNLLRYEEMYASALRKYGNRIGEVVVYPGNRTESLQLTEELSMDILFGESALYKRQKEVFDAAYQGERNGYDLVRWAKSLNV